MKQVTCLLIALLAHYHVIAQYRPPGMADMSVYKNAEDLLEKQIPALENAQFRNNTQNLVKSYDKEITTNLKWIGEGGYLVRVRVYEDPITRKAVPMGPEFMGAGKVPVEIAVANAIKPVATSAPRPNLAPSNRSFYMWITYKNASANNPRLSYGLIEGVLYDKMNIAIANQMATTDLISSFLVAQKAYHFEAIKASLLREVTDRTTALNVAQYMQSYFEQTERLHKLEQQLQHDLKKIQQANEVLKMIQSLQTVLSLASMSLQISAALDDVPANALAAADTPGKQMRLVEEYTRQKNGSVETHRREIIIETDSKNALGSGMDQKLLNLGVPPVLIRPLHY